MKRSVYILLILFLLMLGSCGSDNGFTPPNKEAQDLVDEGWEKFGYKGYQNALLKFEEAIEKDETFTDAYNGAAWACARIPRLQNAANYFSQCLNIDNNYVDAHAGLAFVYNAQKSYANSNTAATTALNKDPDWAFSHDVTVDYKDLQLLMAVNYYALGDLNSSLMKVKILNPLFNADVTSFEGKQALANEIERLGGSI